VSQWKHDASWCRPESKTTPVRASSEYLWPKTAFSPLQWYPWSSIALKRNPGCWECPGKRAKCYCQVSTAVWLSTHGEARGRNPSLHIIFADQAVVPKPISRTLSSHEFSCWGWSDWLVTLKALNLELPTTHMAHALTYMLFTTQHVPIPLLHIRKFCWCPPCGVVSKFVAAFPSTILAIYWRSHPPLVDVPKLMAKSLQLPNLADWIAKFLV
jgi:hypothetical protein